MTRRLTFTFDNGPCPGATERVLDFLRDRSIRATFFVIGERLLDPRARALAERAKAEGHWIGNHTMTHGTPLGRDGGADRVRIEIGEAEERLGPLAHPRKFFRPHGGGSVGPHLLSGEALDYLLRERFTVVTWNSAPGDWLEPHRSWLSGATRDLDGLDWMVLVLHDRFIAEMMDTLERFHDTLERRGVEIVQDFPEACVPVETGELRGRAEELATGHPTGRTTG